MLASLVCFAVLTPFRPFAVCFVGCFGGGTCLPVVCRFFCVFFNVSTVFVTKTLVLFFLLFFLLCFWSAVLLFFHVWGSVSLLCCGLGLGIAMHESSPFFLRCFWCFFLVFCCQIDVLMCPCFTGLSLVFCCVRSGLLFDFFLLCFFACFYWVSNAFHHVLFAHPRIPNPPVRPYDT